MNDSGLADPKLPARRLSGFSFGRQWRLTKKELAETLRDRRTIVTLVLMPILVYPLLAFVFRQFLTTSFARPGETTAIIGIDDDTVQMQAGEEPLHTVFQAWLNLGQRELQGDQVDVEPALVDEPTFESVKFSVGDAERLLREGQVDLAVKVGEPDANIARPNIEIVYAVDSQRAASLRSFVERRIRAFNAWRQRSMEKEASDHLRVGMLHEAVTFPTAQRSLLPSVVPLVLLLMTITGAVYPAIDLTAGERERGTLEALIAAPVSRAGVLMAKYVAVLVVALLTAGMNLLGMGLTIYSTGLSGLLIAPGQNVPLLAVQILGLLLLFASFFAAVLLAVTSFARSFKEAQAYLIPIMLVTLAPGLMSLSPALELNGLLAVIPLVNVVLLARDVFAGGTDPFIAITVVLSTALYAAVAIALAARIFGSDAILYGSGGTWSDLLHRPKQPATAPSLVSGLLCLAIVFAAMINLGGAGSMLAAEAGPRAQLLTSALMTALVFAVIPTLAAVLENVRLADALRAKLPAIRFWLAAGLLGASVGVLVFELTVLGLAWNVTTIGEELKEIISKRAAELNSLPLAIVLLTMAIVPALAEELFFRGYLFRALEVRWTAAATILGSAAAFGLFHTIGLSGLTIERLFPSLLLGFVLGVLAYRSGSVWPGILLHAINNSLLLVVARSKETLVAQGWLPAELEHVPALWLAIAVALALIGLVIVVLPRRKR